MSGLGFLQTTVNLHLAMIPVLGLVTATEAEEMDVSEIEQGATYRCSASVPERDVVLWVGEIEDIDGTTIVSVTLDSATSIGERPVAHAPFDIQQLAGCVREEPAQPFVDPARFEEGYQIWKAALMSERAGWFIRPPSEIYWLSLGVPRP